MSRYINYTKYFEQWDELSIEDLLEKLSDSLLQSGFDDFYSRFNPGDEELTMQNLYDMLMDEMSQWDSTQQMEQNQLQELIRYIMQRMVEEGYIRPEEPGYTDEVGEVAPPPQSKKEFENVRFELTDKSIDFLGFKKLKDLLGAVGRSSIGRHDTNHLSTGVEATEAPKHYEFGDTLNLDISATLLSCVKREGLRIPLPLEKEDLMVQ